MQLPITDQFLLTLAKFIQGIDSAYDIFAPRSLGESVNPELFKLRRELARKRDWKNFSQLVYHLKRKGYIKIKNMEQKQGVMLTSKGADKVLRVTLKTMRKQKRKDGKWQMIIFDIPESKKALREILRKALYTIGYHKLQDSVWVCPYDVAKETELVIRDYGIDPYIKIFLIEEISI